jgi:peptide-methionine (S)-S-oxide reductase
MAKAMFAAGCFWGVEEAFRKVAGVTDVAVGYSGGSVSDPSEEQVRSGRTGHAEVVLVEFDQRKVDYDELLEVFWECHDPTQVNRQGADVGSQYRSAIFTFDSSQDAVARESKHGHDASGQYARPIATEILPAGPFWRAAEHHQRYLAKRRAAVVEPTAG